MRAKLASILLTASVLIAGHALALDPADKCEAGKNQEAGKYAQCRLKAEAKAIKKGLAPDYSKCDQKIAQKWSKLEEQADGACPSSGDRLDIQGLIDGALSAVSTLLSGGLLFDLDQQIDGLSFRCDSVGTTADYTECTGITVGPSNLVGFQSGIACVGGGAWSTETPSDWDAAGFCASRTGSTQYEIFLDDACSPSAPRATWNAGVWGEQADNGHVSAIRCYFPSP